MFKFSGSVSSDFVWRHLFWEKSVIKTSSSEKKTVPKTKTYFWNLKTGCSFHNTILYRHEVMSNFSLRGSLFHQLSLHATVDQRGGGGQKFAKNQTKEGKIREKRQNQEDSFTLPHLTGPAMPLPTTSQQVNRQHNQQSKCIPHAIYSPYLGTCSDASTLCVSTTRSCNLLLNTLQTIALIWVRNTEVTYNGLCEASSYTCSTRQVPHVALVSFFVALERCS